MARVYLSVAEVCEIHARVLRHSGGQDGIRDKNGLESAVFRPQSGYYSDELEEAAALLESLVQNHPFLDGNKRTAWIATVTFLNTNGYELVVETNEAERFLLDNLAQGSFRFPAIRAWLGAKARPLTSG